MIDASQPRGTDGAVYLLRADRRQCLKAQEVFDGIGYGDGVGYIPALPLQCYYACGACLIKHGAGIDASAYARDYRVFRVLSQFLDMLKGFLDAFAVHVDRSLAYDKERSRRARTFDLDLRQNVARLDR